MHVVFRHDKDVVSKNPAGGVNLERVARKARRQGVLSLGHVSLHEQRKVARSCEAGVKALLSRFHFGSSPWPVPFFLILKSQRNGGVKGFRSPSGSELLFFACAKKR